MTDSTQKTPGAWRAALFLFVMATLIPELLIGSTPLSRINQLIFQFPLYGSAALVIREMVIRFRLGRAGLVVLGLAYGVTIEGLALQSLFNPHFLTLDISFGRAAGVNWPWAIYMVAYHALWSVTIPVTLAELVFPQRATESWLGRFGTGAFFVWLLVMVAAFRAIFVKMSGYQAPVAQYAGAAGLIVLLALVGLQLKRSEPSGTAAAPARMVPGVFMFLFGLLWLVLYGDIFHHPHLLSVTGNLVAALVLATGFALLSRQLARAAWTPCHWLAFVAGGLAANSLFGFVVVTGSINGSKVDLYGQVGIVVLVAIGLVALSRRLARRGEVS